MAASLVVASGLWVHVVAVCRLLIVAASLVVASRLWVRALVLVVCGLSCSTVRGIFPDQGLNQCFLYWQTDSDPLHHHGSPIVFLNSAIFISVFYGLLALPGAGDKTVNTA